MEDPSWYVLFFSVSGIFIYIYPQKRHELRHVSQRAKPSATSGITLNIYSPRRLPRSGILCKNSNSTIRRRKVKSTAKKRIDTFFAASGTMACIWTMCMNASRRILPSSQSSALTGSSRADLLRNCREDVIRCWGWLRKRRRWDNLRKLNRNPRARYVWQVSEMGLARRLIDYIFIETCYWWHSQGREEGITPIDACWD